MRESALEPGSPDLRGPGRYLWWLAVSQRRRIAAGALFGSSWMVGLTLSPYLLSRAIDDGLRGGHRRALIGWAGALLAVGVVNAWLGIMRHRTMSRIRWDAAFRTVRLVIDQTTRLGAALPRSVTAGEVVSIGLGDVYVISDSLTVTGPGVGAVVAYVVVAALLLSVSPLLAAVVLLGVPLLVVLVGPLLGRLRHRQTEYREQQGRLAAQLSDIVGGLRVLGGLGGKDVYAGRYREGSRRLVAQGYRVGSVTSWIEALGTGLPMVFLAAVTWLAARMAAQGTITVGELVAVYGYAAVLVVPVSFFIEGGYEVTHGLVAARRVVRFLRLEPDGAVAGGSGVSVGDAPAEPAPLHDPASGVEVLPGRLTALVSGRPAESAAVVDRLGRFTESAATWGGVPLAGIPLPRIRERILVADNEADLFAGTLSDIVAGRADPDDGAVRRALRTAVAEDIVHGLPDGLGSRIDAQGRNLSGGQRQRVRLARAVLADPEVLLAVEPTSAVDAHTEAAVAERLYTARAGRTTLVTSTSPLILDRADTVYYLVDGKVAAEGRHHDLLQTHPGYRHLVSRGAGDEDERGPADGDPRPAGEGGPGLAGGGGPRPTGAGGPGPADKGKPGHAGEGKPAAADAGGPGPAGAAGSGLAYDGGRLSGVAAPAAADGGELGPADDEEPGPAGAAGPGLADEGKPAAADAGGPVPVGAGEPGSAGEAGMGLSGAGGEDATDDDEPGLSGAAGPAAAHDDRPGEPGPAGAGGPAAVDGGEPGPADDDELRPAGEGPDAAHGSEPGLSGEAGPDPAHGDGPDAAGGAGRAAGDAGSDGRGADAAGGARQGPAAGQGGRDERREVVR